MDEEPIKRYPEMGSAPPPPPQANVHPPIGADFGFRWPDTGRMRALELAVQACHGESADMVLQVAREFLVFVEGGAT